MEFDEQGGYLGQAELRIEIGGLDHQCVEELDPGYRNPALNGQDGRPTGTRDGVEWTDAAGPGPSAHN